MSPCALCAYRRLQTLEDNVGYPEHRVIGTYDLSSCYICSKCWSSKRAVNTLHCGSTKWKFLFVSCDIVSQDVMLKQDQ